MPPLSNPFSSSSAHSKWLLLALSSGGFAALNGLFAKLTTTDQTSTLSTSISHFLSLPESWGTFIEYLIRGLFFLLNLLSNITMWALFTRALTASSSTTRVSVVNTSANFFVTAVLGMVVFAERVGGLWWLGALGMGVGCVVVGMRDEGQEGKKGEERDGEEEGVVLLSGEEREREREGSEDGEGRKGDREDEDLLRL